MTNSQKVDEILKNVGGVRPQHLGGRMYDYAWDQYRYAIDRAEPTDAHLVACQKWQALVREGGRPE